MMTHDKESHSIIKSTSMEDLSEAFLKKVGHIIHEKIGILVKPDNHELKKFIKNSFNKGHENHETFIKNLENANQNSDIMLKMIGAITIGETSFFRDKKQIDILESYVIPTIINNNLKSNRKSLRIWSAGCSSGEELYTLIMLFSKAIPDIKTWKFQFLGTDINVDQINKARIGKYNEWVMRSTPKNDLNKYFICENKQYQLTNEIIKKARFDYLNLSTDSYPSLLNGTEDQDLILCRNVLIYFDVNHTDNIYKKLANCLHNDGFLLVGASDPSFNNVSQLLRTDLLPSLYVKSNRNMPTKTHDKIKKPIHIIMEPSYRHKSENAFKIEDIYQAISNLQSQSKWQNIIFIIDDVLSKTDKYPDLYVIKSNALANLGMHEQALVECEKCLELNPLNKEAYFTRALICNENQMFYEAEKSFTQALFIDPEFLICRYQFGLFLIRHNQYEKGIRMLTNAMDDAIRFEKNEIVPYTNNMNYADLINLLKNEIKVHKKNNNEDVL